MKSLLIASAILLTACQSFGQAKRLKIENVTVIPLHVNQQWNNRDVIVDDGRIIDIRHHNEGDTSTYGLGVIDGAEKYLTSAYTDAHSHLREKENLESYFLMNLINGVTTLRSMRGELWHLDIEREGKLTPRLILSSPPVTRNDNLSKTVIDTMFDKYESLGFDFVKVLSVENEQIFHLLATSARTKGLRLAGHCPSDVGLRQVVESEVFQSVEHLGGFFQLRSLDEINQVIGLSILKGMYFCATLDWYYTGQVLEDKLRERIGTNYLPLDLIEGWEEKIAAHYAKTTENERKIEREDSKEQFQVRLNYLKHIYDQGARLLLSPDASGIYSVPGYGIHTEMQHYRDAGISNFDILKIASYNLSEMQSTQNDWGTVKIGAQSDMVLLDKNPVDDILNARSINGIVFKGVFYKRQDLTELLDSRTNN